MNIAAFDLSLTATGFATNYAVIPEKYTAPSSGVIEPAKLRGTERLRHIRDMVLDIASGADVVALEGLAFGAKGSAILDLAGLAAVVRVALAEAEIAYVDVPPSCLKLFATGKGNAKKDEVLVAAVKKLDYARSDHNEADALWLLEMAKRRYCDEQFDRDVVIHERRALEKIKWPELAAHV